MKKFYFFLLLLFFPFYPLQAKDFNKINLASEWTSILQDRLQLQLPKGFFVAPRPRSPLGEIGAKQKESRLIYHKANRQVAVVAMEHFLYGGKNFEKEIVKFIKADWQKKGLKQIKLSPLKVEGNFKVYQIKFLPPVNIKGVSSPGGAVVLNQDSTLQSLLVYANPKASKDLVSLERLFERSFNTLRPGPRRLFTQNRREILASTKSPQKFSMKVPEGYVRLTEVGPDFLVHRFFPMETLGKKFSFSSLGIYVGFQPDYPQQNGKKIKKLLFGSKVDWLEARPRGPEVFRETLYPGTEGPDQEQFHLFYRSSSSSQLNVLEKMAESLRLSK